MPDGYGAVDSNNTGEPIGGGAGCATLYTTGDYVVESRTAFLDALDVADPGEVIYIPDNTFIHLPNDLYVPIPGEIIIASCRGAGSAKGGGIYTTNMSAHWQHFLELLGNNIKFSGMILQGPDDKVGGNGADPLLVGIWSKGRTGLEVYNCELRNWTHAAVQIQGDSVDGIDNPGAFHVHHSLFHHNQRDGVGYGVDTWASSGLIEANIFDYSRHHVAGQRGLPVNYVETRYNLFRRNCINTMYDQHGGNDSQSWGNPNPPDPDCPAGGLLLVHHNTFETSTQACVGVRGIPYDLCDVYRNLTWWPQEQSKTCFKQRLENLGLIPYVNMMVRDNWYASGSAPGGSTTYYSFGGTTTPQPPSTPDPDTGEVNPPYVAPGSILEAEYKREPIADLSSVGTWVLYPDDGIKWSKVNNDDDETTYIQTAALVCAAWFDIEPFAMISGTTNIVVTAHVRCRVEGDPTSTHEILPGVKMGDNYSVDADYHLVEGDDFIEFSTVIPYDLSEGTDEWTAERVNANLNGVGVRVHQEMPESVRITRVWVTVAGTEPSPAWLTAGASRCAGPYSLILYGVGGHFSAGESCFLALQVVRRVNSYAEATLVFYGNADIIPYLGLDTQVEIWRSNPLLGISPYKEAELFHRTGQFDWDEHAQSRFTSRCMGYEHLLERRILLGGDDETIYAGGLFSAERVIKELVKCQCGLAGTRGIVPGNPVIGLSVEYSQDRGATWAGYRKGENLLAYIKEIALARDMAFKVISPAPSTFVFQAYPNPYGLDRTATTMNRTTGRNAAGNIPIVFSEQRSNISTIGYHSIREGEGNVAIDVSGGLATSATGEFDSPWNRCEFVITLSAEEVAAEVASEALSKMAAREEVPIQVIQTRECCYGRHYFLGDTVTIFVSAPGIDKVLTSVITGVILEVSRREGQLDEKITLELSSSAADVIKSPVQETLVSLHKRLRKVELRA